MARENAFIIIGELVNAPIVLLNEEYKNYRISFSVKTVRRNGRMDYPKISVYGLSEEDARAYMRRMKPGVFIMVRGMLSTKMLKKPVKCEACGAISQISTLQTEIICYSNPFIFGGAVDPKEIAEFSNIGNLIGSLCTDVSRMDSANGPTAAQFQMAVNRRYRVRELEHGVRTDYPWIKAFGPTADECLKRLRKSSQVYVSGAYQTRDISRHLTCESCGKQIVYTERVGEVIPSGIEFLNHCLFEQKEDTKAAEEGAANEKEKA